MKRKPVKRKVVKRRKPVTRNIPWLIGFTGACFQEIHERFDKLQDRIAETNERLRVIEADIEKIQRYVGVLANKQSASTVPVSSPDWRPALSNRTSL